MKSNYTRQIILTIIFIISFSFITDKIVFFTLNKISDQLYSSQSIGKLNRYLELKNNLDFIVYGSSRANHHINTIKITPNSFNMGLDGRQIAYCTTLIKLLPKNKKQTILIHIDPTSAFNKDYIGKDILALNSKYNRNKKIKNEIDKINQNNILQNFYWSLSYNGKTLGILKNYLIPNRIDKSKYYGYEPLKVSKLEKNMFLKSLKKIKEEKDCLEEYTLNNLYDKYIDEIKQFCDNNNKNLIFFTAPTYKDNCKTDNKKFKEILNNKKIYSYYDLTDFFNKNNSTEYWKDETHLSDKGAEIFTEKIKNLLNKKQ